MLDLLYDHKTTPERREIKKKGGQGGGKEGGEREREREKHTGGSCILFFLHSLSGGVYRGTPVAA